MRIREARIRDSAAIAKLTTGEGAVTEDEVMGMIQKNDPKIYVAADFSANIWGCALGADKVYIAENCLEQGLAEDLKKMY